VIARLPGGGQLSVSDTTGSWFSSRDRHGDVTSRYTPTGTVTGSTAYNPFGETTTSTGSRLGGGLGFQGDWTDPSTGLVNQGTRWYQPTTGAFASRDSYNGQLDSPVSLNRYTYGANNPLRYFDPDGRQSLDQALAGVLFGPEANSPVRAASFNYSIDFYRATERARETEALYNLAQFRIDIMSFAGMVGGGTFNPNNDAVINSAAHAIVSINQSTFDNAAHNNALDGNIAKSDFEKISKTASAPLKFAADILLANNNKYDQDKPDQLIGWRAWETKPKQDWLERNWKTIVVIGVGILAGAACGAAGPVVAAMCGGAASRFTGSMLNGGGFVSSLGAAFNPKALATDAVIGWATAGLANAAGNGIKTLRTARAARAAGEALDELDDIARVSSVNATNTATRGAGDGYAGRILEGGRPDGQTVFAGHGEYRFGSGATTVPEGTSVNVYAPHGQGIPDSLGGAIETGGSVAPYRVYGPGEQIPNYTLKTPDGLTVYSGSTTVQASTPLSELLQPGMGSCHWAACVNVR
jgi:RHS repeat-associated protein